MQGTKEKFKEYIAVRGNSIEKFKAALKSNNVAKDRVSGVKDAILHLGLTITIAHYSAGDPKEVVKNSLIETISAFEDGFNWLGFEGGYGQYDEMIWIVSLGLLCEIELENFTRITRIIERDKATDKLLDFLIKHKQPYWNGNSSQFIQKHPYAYLSKTIDEVNSEVGIENLINYLKPAVWYKGHSDASWHDSHKNEKVNVYVGYWAWEAAALIKAKGWDDIKLKSTDYYPYEAVHW